MERTSSAETGGQRPWRIWPAQGTAKHLPVSGSSMGGRVAQGPSCPDPLQQPPPQRALALPQDTARGSCSLLCSQGPQSLSSLYPTRLSPGKYLLPMWEPSAHLLMPGLIPIAAHSHPHSHCNEQPQTQQPKTTQIYFLVVLDVRSPKRTLLS